MVTLKMAEFGVEAIMMGDIKFPQTKQAGC